MPIAITCSVTITLSPARATATVVVLGPFHATQLPYQYLHVYISVVVTSIGAHAPNTILYQQR